MKKLLPLAVLLLCLGGGLFAQENTPRFKNESEYYYFNVPIEKIFSYRKGYIVVYRKGVNQMARTYLPGEWFTGTTSKGEMIGLGSGNEWPSITIYYKSGEFSHVRLRVRRARTHETWGVVPLNVNIDEHFQGIEEVHLEF